MQVLTRIYFACYSSVLRAVLLLVLIVTSVGAITTGAQSLNWEGQDGIFVTPLAYTPPSDENHFARPVVAYHYLNGGVVLGGFNQISVTMGAFRRIEFGYTRDVHLEGNTAGVSNLWTSGFNAFHGKVNLVEEDRGWIPSISAGFMVRSQVHNVGGVLQNKDLTNADFYAVATKTITDLKKISLVLNFGVKGTNASLLGLAGNAPDYEARVFGAVAVGFKGPGRSTILLASEVLQEPHRVQGLPDIGIPTTLTYAVRVVPGGALPMHGWGVESPRLTVDFGVAQIAGEVAPGINLQARHQFALGVTYGF
jgi:hypothetical protein